MERSENKELMVGKWTRGVMMWKRAEPSTPPPTWRLELYSQREDPEDNDNDGHGTSVREFLNFRGTALSARKLGGNLWEFHPHHPLAGSGGGGAKLRRKPRRRRKGEGFESHVAPPKTPPEQPEDSTSLKRYNAASMMQHHRSVGGCPNTGIRPMSPSSGSSMELAPFNHDGAPSNSLGFKGRIGNSSYSFKTSTELLKVLNRIWALEEQHTSNMTLVKSLKKEVNHSHSRIKDLMLAKQKERQEMDDLVKQVAEDKLIRRNEEKARLKAAIQTVKDELEYERTLRNCSESLHKKLSRDLSQVKLSFSCALKELESERKARISLENLCDEFAKGIREYEKKLRNLKLKYERGHVDDEEPEKLILHISEAWLDERIQMKQTEGPSTNSCEKDMIVDKLGLDIETFLQGKRTSGQRESSKAAANEVDDNILRRYSLESFPLNESASAPQGAIDDEDSCHSDSCYNVLDKKINSLNSRKSSKNVRLSGSTKKKVRSREVSKGGLLHGLQRKSEHWPRSKIEFVESNNEQADDEALVSRSEIHEAIPDDVQDRDIRTAENFSSYPLNDMVRSLSLSSEGDKVHPEMNTREDSCPDSAFRGHASQRLSKLASPELEKPECSLRLPPDVKENTLKAKLLEARLEGRQSHSKTSKAST